LIPSLQRQIDNPLLPLLAEKERRRRVRERVVKRVATVEDFKAYVLKANPKFKWYGHCEKIARVLIRIANDEIKRAMFFVPPRHSKSETISRLFSGYYLSLHPERFVGINSYSAELAYTLSRAARENFQRNGGVVKSDAAAVKHWETEQGGGLWAAGVGGPITGKGFHLGIIDDPLKNAEEAGSETIREKQKEWYGSTFYTREEPGGAIIIIQTRWHQDDLSGWLLSQENEDDQPERWHVVSFEAIKEDDRPEIPSTCSLEPDHRAKGEALCPERYGVEKLTKIAARVGGYFWTALFQQRPTAKEGAFFKVAKMDIESAAPVGLRMCRGWDLAATENAGDFTAGVKIGKAPDGLWWILDVARGQWGADTVERQLVQTAKLDGNQVKIATSRSWSGRKRAIATTHANAAGFPVSAERISGDKETRAFNFAAQVNAGNVRIVEGFGTKHSLKNSEHFHKARMTIRLMRLRMHSID
jgi:predicted phage terminase large subunit-like protein